MKNVIQFSNNVKCSSCYLNGFFCYTPDGGDYTTCPLCEKGDFMSVNHSDDYDDAEHFYNKNFKNYDEIEEKYLDYKFCSHCKIIFTIGCMHAANGCTSSCYNSHLIGKWKYKNEIYIGMPQFDSIEEWYNDIDKIETLDLICPNNGFICSTPAYPITTHPQYYHECKFKK